MIIGQFAPRERQKCFFHFFKISSFGKMQIFQPKKLYTAHKIDFGAFYGLTLILQIPHFQFYSKNTSDLLHKTHFFHYYFSEEDFRGHRSHYCRFHSNILNFYDFKWFYQYWSESQLFHVQKFVQNQLNLPKSKQGADKSFLA